MSRVDLELHRVTPRECNSASTTFSRTEIVRGDNIFVTLVPATAIKSNFDPTDDKHRGEEGRRMRCLLESRFRMSGTIEIVGIVACRSFV